MPLKPGSSPAVISSNISELIRSGKSQKQAVAIALKHANKSKRAREVAVAFDPFVEAGGCSHTHPPEVPSLPCPAAAKEGESTPTIYIDRLRDRWWVYRYESDGTLKGTTFHSSDDALEYAHREVQRLHGVIVDLTKSSKAEESSAIPATIPVVEAACVPFVKVQRDPEMYAASLKTAATIGPLDTPADIYALVGDYLAREDQEVFLVVLIDHRGQCRGVCEVARGQRSSVAVDVADVLRPVINAGASGFIVCHNHPTGAAKPSKADAELTDDIRNAASLAIPEVEFCDHVVVGMGEYYSFDEKKLYKVKGKKE